MKSKTLKRLDLLVSRYPTTISQWLRYRDEYVELKKTLLNSAESAPPFELGHLMPVRHCETVRLNLSPKGMSHLFAVESNRFPQIIDYNSTKVRTRRGWRTKSYGKHEIHVTSISVFLGRKLEWLCGPSDVVLKFILPIGWQWKKDDLGICAVDSDGIDYHPYWTGNITLEHILDGHAQNKETRIRRLEERSRKEQFDSLFNRDVAQTYVNLDDSRRAGNCVEGALVFAEKRLGLTREEILNSGYLFQINALRLIKTNEPRAILAARCAWERETTISI